MKERIKTIRVFPRETKWTPADELVFFDRPTLYVPKGMPVRVSVCFTWDKERGYWLRDQWAADSRFPDVQIGGPAIPGSWQTNGEFTPGMYIKHGVTFTSRGCPKRCGFCFVPKREGPLRELQIKLGHIVQDNNLLACRRPHIESVFEMLKVQPEPIEFKGGLDIDFLKPWHVDLLKTIRLKSIWVSCDNRKTGLARLDKVVDLLSDFSIEKKRCYVLVGLNGETQSQAQARLEAVYDKGFLPFAQLYRGMDSPMSRGDWREFCYFWSTPKLYRKAMKARTKPRKDPA